MGGIASLEPEELRLNSLRQVKCLFQMHNF